MAAAVAAQQPKQNKNKAKKDAGELPSIPKPNEEVFRAAEELLLQKIEELRKQQTVMSQKIRDNQGGTGEFSSKTGETRKQIDSLQKQMTGFHAERQLLQKQINELQETSRNKRNEVFNMKKGLEFSSEADLEERLQELEHYLATSSISLKEEKKLVVKIEQLKRMKPDVQKYRNLESSMLEEDTNSVGQLRKKLDFVRDEIKRLATLREEEYKKLNQIQDDRNKATEPLKVLFDDRLKVEAELKDQNGKLHVLRSENNDKMREYYEFMTQSRKKKQEIERQEKHKSDLARDIERAQELLDRLESEGLDIPGMADLQIMYRYVEKLAADHKQTATDEATPTANADDTVAEAGDGEWTKPKNKREEYNEVTSKKQKGKTRKQKKMREMTHDIRTLVSFGELGIEPPETYNDLSATLEQLKMKLDEKEGMRDQYKQKTQKQKDDLTKKITDLTMKLKMLDEGPAVYSPAPTSPHSGGTND